MTRLNNATSKRIEVKEVKTININGEMRTLYSDNDIFYMDIADGSDEVLPCKSTTIMDALEEMKEWFTTF